MSEIIEASWKNILVHPNNSVLEALQVIDKRGLRLVLVVDEAGQLLGSVTDGDIRRALLRKVDMSKPVVSVMNRNPYTARIGASSRDALLTIMMERSLLHIPLVDDSGRLVGLETYHDLSVTPMRENWVFLMAGGFGTRLRPLTDDCPKPMLRVGGKPMLEIILANFISAGFRRFYISVHHLSKQIKNHFGDGSNWGVTIVYIEEATPLGTGGALGLLPTTNNLPIVMMNGDVLTQINIKALLDFHIAECASLTLSVKEYEMQVPFGVVVGDGTRVTGIIEKPVRRFFINAGVYVLSPEVIESMQQPSSRLDMPDLVQALIKAGKKVSKFPVHECWLDIGQPDDYERAQTL